MSTNITFNSFDLQTDNIITAEIQHEGGAAIDAEMVKLSHANRSIIPQVNFPNRTITVSGKIQYSSISALDSALDTFRGSLLGREKNLDIDYAGATRRYIATMSNLTISRPFGLTYADFTITFSCTKPFGYATSQTTLFDATGVTASTSSQTCTFVGSSPLQYPIITVQFSASGGAGTITIDNDDTGQAIVLASRTWGATDLLEIDTLEGTVTVNGAPAEYTGAFPVFAPGAGQINYTDTLSSRTVQFKAVYTKAYL